MRARLLKATRSMRCGSSGRAHGAERTFDSARARARRSSVSPRRRMRGVYVSRRAALYAPDPIRDLIDIVSRRRGRSARMAACARVPRSARVRRRTRRAIVDVWALDRGDNPGVALGGGSCSLARWHGGGRRPAGWSSASKDGGPLDAMLPSLRIEVRRRATARSRSRRSVPRSRVLSRARRWSTRTRHLALFLPTRRARRQWSRQPGLSLAA